jgi:glycosyltransferase involved in cell wall biosynthesis
MPSPSVSVIVTARNEERTVGRCLSALLKQDYPNYSIVFIDAGSHDTTLRIAQEMVVDGSNLKVIQFDGSPSQCRNMAIRMSSSDAVAFTDADVEVPISWLTRIVETLFSNPEIGGVGGPNKPTREKSGELIKTVDLMLTTSLGSMRSAQSYDFKERTVVKSIPCCNAAYPRQLLLDVGGFDEDLVGCDDTDLGYRITRMGKKLLFDPKASVLHSVKFGTLRQFAGLMFKYGRGRGYAAKRKRYLFSGPAIPAAGLILGFPLLVIGTAISRSIVPLAIVTMGYLAAAGLFSVGVAVSRKAPKAALLGPVVLTTEYVSYFAGFLAGIIDRRPNRWSN